MNSVKTRVANLLTSYQDQPVSVEDLKVELTPIQTAPLKPSKKATQSSIFSIRCFP